MKPLFDGGCAVNLLNPATPRAGLRLEYDAALRLRRAFTAHIDRAGMPQISEIDIGFVAARPDLYFAGLSAARAGAYFWQGAAA